MATSHRTSLRPSPWHNDSVWSDPTESLRQATHSQASRTLSFLPRNTSIAFGSREKCKTCNEAKAWLNTSIRTLLSQEVIQGKFLGHLLYKVTLWRASFIFLCGVVYTTFYALLGQLNHYWNVLEGETPRKLDGLFSIIIIQIYVHDLILKSLNYKWVMQRIVVSDRYSKFITAINLQI